MLDKRCKGEDSLDQACDTNALQRQEAVRVKTSQPSSVMWSVQDLATFLGVPVATIYRWSSAHDGPPGYRVGRYLRFKPAEVEQWLDSQQKPGGGAAA